MKYYDYLIIGGGIAGVTAAETIRERDRAGSIAVVSDEPHPLYSRVLLPRFVRGEIRKEQLFLRRREDYEAKNIAFLAGEAASGLNIVERFLALASGNRLGFSKLLIAGGAKPRPLGIDGEGLAGVSRFQTINDADLMAARLGQVKKAAVAGGSFIALEYLEVLARRNIPTALIVRDEHFFNNQIDAVADNILRENFLRHGVEMIRMGDGLAEIAGRNEVEGIRTSSGFSVECDFLGLGVGLDRSHNWLAGSDLALTDQGVRVDAFLQTAVSGIFAAGDCADIVDAAGERLISQSNWTSAFIQGKTAGWNMAESEAMRPFAHVSSYSIRNLGFAIMFVGETIPAAGIETVSRFDKEKNIYERFFLSGGRLIGAIIINRVEDQPALAALIAKKIPIQNASARLADMRFDVASLIYPGV